MADKSKFIEYMEKQLNIHAFALTKCSVDNYTYYKDSPHYYEIEYHDKTTIEFIRIYKRWTYNHQVEVLLAFVQASRY